MNKISKMVLVGMVLSTSVQAQDVSVHVERDTLFGNGNPTSAKFVLDGDNTNYDFMWRDGDLTFVLRLPLKIVRNRNVNHRGADWVPSNQPAKRDEWEVVTAPYMLIAVEGLTKCLEGVSFDILFEDNSKISFMNLDTFSCGAIGLRPLNDENTKNEGAIPSLMRGVYDKKFDYTRMAKRIKAVRFINLRSGTTSVYVPKDEMEKNYFIEIVTAYNRYTRDRAWER